MSDAAVPQPGIPPPAAAPVLTSRARARLRFWAGLLLFFALALAASFAAYRYRQSQPAAILPSAPPRPGEGVKQADTIVKFDSSSAHETLMQKEAALRQAQATLDQALAQSKIT